MQQEEEAKAQQSSSKTSHHVSKWKQDTQQPSEGRGDGNPQMSHDSDGTQYIEYDEDDIVSSGEES